MPLSLITADGDTLLVDPSSEFQYTPEGFNTGLASNSVPLSLWDGSGGSYRRLYETQSSVARAVNKLTRQVARMPLKVYTGDSSSGKQRVTEGPLVDAIKTPARGRSAIHLKQWLTLPALIHGNALVEKTRDRPGGPLKGFWPLNWRQMIPKWIDDDPEKPIDYWIQVPANGPRRVILPQDVIHVAWHPPAGQLGVSPLKQLGVTMTIERSAQLWQAATFRNAARPSGGVTLPDNDLAKDKEFRREFRDDLARLQQGGHNAGRPIVLPPGGKWEAFSYNAAEAALIDQRKLGLDEVAGVYDVPPPMIGILEKATFCLPADALVMTERGSVPINTVESGDRVWSLRDRRLSLCAVSRSRQTGVKPLLTIATTNRTLRCTDNHPILVARRIKGDRTKSKPHWRHEWRPAGQLAVGDLIITAAKLPSHGVRTCPTRDVTVGFAEFCGHYLGNGNLMFAGDQPAGVSIARDANARYMGHYRNVMRSEFRRLQTGGRDVARADRERLPITLQEQGRATRFSSVLAGEELIELGLGGHAPDKQVPEWVFKLAPDLRAAFLRGYCDADGHVDKRGHLAVHSSSETMLRQMRELCIGLGVPVSNVRAQRAWVTLPDGNRVFSVAWTFKAADPQANASIIGSHDPLDRERLAAGKPWGRKAYRYSDKFAGSPPAIDGCALARVRRIERGEVSVPVYDLTVPESHNFIADGVIVHNSNITEQHQMLFTDVLGPWFSLEQESFNSQVCAEEAELEGQWVEFDLRDVLRGDPVKAAIAEKTQIATGTLTIDEARDANNRPRFGGVASEPLIASNNLSRLESLAEEEVDDPEDPDDPEQARAIASNLERAVDRLYRQACAGRLAWDPLRFQSELAADLDRAGAELAGRDAAAWTAAVDARVQGASTPDDLRAAVTDLIPPIPEVSE